MSTSVIIGGIILLIIMLIVISGIFIYSKISNAASNFKKLLVPKDSYIASATGGLSCESGKGGLCYKPCNVGYHAFGCCICSPDCPSNMQDTGIGCIKPAQAATVGVIPQFSCPAGYTKIGFTCTRDNGYYNYSPGCVACYDGTNICKNDCYRTWIISLQTIAATPTCAAGFVNKSGLCYPPSSVIPCPSGFTDLTLTCHKPPPYGRDVGIVPTTCPTGQVKSGALCYPNCKTGYHQIAGVCWED